MLTLLGREVWASTLHRGPPGGGAFSVRATPANGQSDKEAVIFPENIQEECKTVLYTSHASASQFNKPVTKHGCLKAVRMGLPKPLAVGSSSTLICKIALSGYFLQAKVLLPPYIKNSFNSICFY